MRGLRSTAMGGAVVLTAAAALASPLLTTTATAGSIETGGHSIQTADNEAHLVIEGGKTVTKDVTCAKGYFATSGGFLADAVDDGDNASVYVLASRPTGDNLGWSVTIRNDNEGRAQGKAKVSCVALATTKAKDGHSHAFEGLTGASDAATIAADESGTLTATCATGIPQRPAFTSSKAVVLTGMTVADRAVEFSFDAVETSDVTATVHCLAPQLSAGPDGHRHAVAAALVEVKKPVSLRPGTSDQVVSCPTGSVSLLPSWSTEEAGVYFLGSDPRGTQRMYRFLNDSDEASDATLSMTCLSTVAPPAPEAKAIKLNGDATYSVANDTIRVPLNCNFKCAVTVKLSPENSKKVYGVGKATIDGNGSVVVKMKSKYAGSFSKSTKVSLVATAGRVTLESKVNLVR